MTTMPSSRLTEVPAPPKGSVTSLTIPKPSASSTMTSSRMIRKPRALMYQGALAGGASRPMRRSSRSWRLEGGAWPRRSTAALRSSGRRSASASEASAMRRSCMRSCGREAAMARRK